MLFLALLLLLVSPVWSQGRQPVPRSETPYVTLAANAFSFRTFEDDHGGFYLIWPQMENGQSTLMAQHMDAQGITLWPGLGLTLVQALDPDSAWDAAHDANGGVLLSWEKNGHVLAQRFDPNGKPAWEVRRERVSVDVSTQSAPTLVADGSGGAFVVWQDQLPLPRQVLMAQHINAFGAPLWSSKGSRVSLRPSEQKSARIVYDGNAGVIVVWNDFREDASQLQAQRLNYQGNRLWGLEGILVTAPAGEPDRAPHLGEVGRGSAVFAWKASSSAADRLFLQLADASGKLRWGQGIELNKGNWQEWNPVLHGDGAGGTWVAWEDFRNNQNWVAYAEHLKVDGTPGWPGIETAMTTIHSDQGHLGITDDGQGGILTSWVDNRNGTVGVYLQEINPQGTALLGPDGLLIVNHLVNPQSPRIISLTPGLAAVFWADAVSKGHWALYWKRVPLTPPGGSK